MSDRTLDQLIEDALCEGRLEQARVRLEQARENFIKPKRRVDEKSIKLAYNAASGVLEGLEILNNKPGSKFTYIVEEDLDCLRIETNIPQRKYTETDYGVIDRAEDGRLSIKVEPTGQITARVDAAQVEDVAQIIKAVTRKALVKGLIK